MIERYSTPNMEKIWGCEVKYQYWLDVELTLCEVYAELDIIPEEAIKAIRKYARFDPGRCEELEKVTHHEFMAFLRNLSETVGPYGCYIHLGVTRYDIMDTALALMLKNSCTVLIQSGNELRELLSSLVQKYAHTPMIGRTHGGHAEPITFGFKVGGWHAELSRNMERLHQIRKEVAVGKISGAVGIHATVSPMVEARVCTKLGLIPDPLSTQIVGRDRYAKFLNALAILGANLERIATEIRNLQRTEILEVQEAFDQEPMDLSPMPHKRNPWKSETICGLARILRTNAQAMLECLAIWHERDSTHSSVENIILPESCRIMDFMLTSMHDILSHLTIFPRNMEKNLHLLKEVVYSEHVLLALLSAGMSREEAYGVVQSYASRALEGENFKQLVSQDPQIQRLLSSNQIKEMFSLSHHLRNVDHSLRWFE